MFNIGIRYKSVTPMEPNICTKIGFKKTTPHSLRRGGDGDKITASSVLYFGCSKSF